MSGNPSPSVILAIVISLIVPVGDYNTYWKLGWGTECKPKVHTYVRTTIQSKLPIRTSTHNSAHTSASYSTFQLQLAINVLLSLFKALHTFHYSFSDQNVLLLPTLNDILSLQNFFLPLLKVYNIAKGNGLHSTETAIALNTRLAYVGEWACGV